MLIISKIKFLLNTYENYKILLNYKKKFNKIKPNFKF